MVLMPAELVTYDYVSRSRVKKFSCCPFWQIQLLCVATPPKYCNMGAVWFCLISLLPHSVLSDPPTSEYMPPLYFQGLHPPTCLPSSFSLLTGPEPWISFLWTWAQLPAYHAKLLSWGGHFLEGICTLLFFLILIFVFLELHPWLMEVPRLGVKSEL